MKLLTQTNRIYLAFSLVIYLVTALAFYQIIRFLIYDEVESRLHVEKRDFEAYVRAHNTWASSPYFVENKIEIAPVTGPRQTGETFSDTLIRNHYDNDEMPFRQLTFYTLIQGQLYRIEIRKSLIQTYRLIEVITVTMVLFLGLLLLGMYWFQSRLSGQLWLPFYDTLSRIKAFNLRQGTPLHLPPSSITEFRELNEVLVRMADQMQHDYQGLKEFTENASHEMQTPLALINAKVEQLIQSSQLTQHQSSWIDSIYQASRRMSRLNQGLLLLAKIENRQFVETHPVDLTAELIQRLTDMDEVITHKQLHINSAIDEPFWMNLAPFLGESLVTNLLSNAIRHNCLGGFIQINSTADRLELSNSGPAPTTDPMALFDRFKKGVANSESVGLGLAIVQQICRTNEIEVTYSFTSEVHHLLLVKQ